MNSEILILRGLFRRIKSDFFGDSMEVMWLVKGKDNRRDSTLCKQI